MSETDLPTGYRWATADETESWTTIPGALLVQRTADSDGQPYMTGTCDVAVPQTEWTTEEAKRDFEVLAFAAPYVAVRRKNDDQRGTLRFDGVPYGPRRYFGWVAD